MIFLMIPRRNLYWCVSILLSEYSRMGQAFQSSDRGSALSFEISRGDSSPANTPTDFPAEAKSKENHGVWDPYNNPTLCSLQSRPTHIPRAMGNPMLESTLTLCQSLLYPPVRDFGLWIWPLICVPIFNDDLSIFLGPFLHGPIGPVELFLPVSLSNKFSSFRNCYSF